MITDPLFEAEGLVVKNCLLKRNPCVSPNNLFFSPAQCRLEGLWSFSKLILKQNVLIDCSFKFLTSLNFKGYSVLAVEKKTTS